MPRAYSPDLRERLLRAETAGLSAAEIARTTGVSISSLNRWRVRADRGESLVPGHAPGRALLIGPDRWDALRAQVAARPDATLSEHGIQWETDQQQTVSRATMCRLLKRLGLPLKKKPDRHRAESGGAGGLADRDGGAAGGG